MSSLSLVMATGEAMTPLHLDDGNVSLFNVTELPSPLDPTSPQLPPQGPDRESLQLFLFIFYTVLMGPVCIMGLAGNTISILILSKDSNNRVATFLLKCLALADNLVLLVSFVTLTLVYGLLHYLEGSDLVNTMKPYFYKYVHPIEYISQTLTIWLTVVLAINRYIAICRPFDVHKFCTIRMARVQVFTCVAVTILLNLPRFFQYHIVRVSDGNSTRLRIKQSQSIRESTLFGMIVTNGLFTVLVLVLPLILLLIVNTRLIRELQRMRRRIHRSAHPTLSSGAPGSPSDSNSDGERNITFVMVTIIVVLLVCHTPDRVAQLLRVTVPARDRNYPTFTFIFTNIANFLIVLNSSTNFFIYYFLRQRFRLIFRAAFGCKPKAAAISDEDKLPSLLLQSTPLTAHPENTCAHRENNDSDSVMVANGKGI